MPGKTLVILGSGPGIGIAVAKVFSVRGFTHVALVSRNKERLAQDEDSVLDAIQERGYSCRVKTWVCDIADLKQLNGTLKEIESFGSLECVLFNPARVAGKPPLKESNEAIEADFRVCSCFPSRLLQRRRSRYSQLTFNLQLTNIGLHETAKWAIPLLKQAPEDSLPSLFVTSTTQLYKEPVPQLASLSMVKSAQRSLVLSLNALHGKDVHIALVSVGGVVSPDAKNLSPENIAEQAYKLYKQPRGSWEREVEIHE
jgi:NAD(P)-dependent dehydrogenase (short-subunit alcohol dehydrogenase family)